jgi:hypothetical protein
MWFKYDRDWLCVNKSQFFPLIFEPPCESIPLQAYIGSEGYRRLRLPGGKVFRPYAPAAFTFHGRLLALISCSGWANPRATVRPEGLGQWRIPMAPSGIEPANLLLVTLCMEQQRYHVPPVMVGCLWVLWLCFLISEFHIPKYICVL